MLGIPCNDNYKKVNKNKYFLSHSITFYLTEKYYYFCRIIVSLVTKNRLMLEIKGWKWRLLVEKY